MFLAEFWRRYPGLLYGLACLLGSFAALKSAPILIFPAVFLLFQISWIRVCLAAVLFVCVLLVVQIRYQFPELPEDGVTGTVYFQIDSLSNVRHHFGRKWIYRGKIATFIPDAGGMTARNLPCRIVLPDKPELLRPSADGSYIIQGRLQKMERGGYLFKMAKEAPWSPVARSFSLAEARYRAKAALSNYISRHVGDERSSVFLTGIVTGEFDDRLMQHEFGRFGLQHIMAISGFHFSIIASILSFLLRLVMGHRAAMLCLVGFLSAYFLFLGLSPSIMRAWITIMIALSGVLWERKGSGLNALGLSMMAVLLHDPLLCLHIGFQYSFAATAAILLLYGPCEQFLQKLFPKRRLSQALKMDRFNQHGYLLVTLLRQAMALGIAVNLVTIPMMLTHFQQFPVMSLVYNLFFPSMVSLSMLLLILGMLVGWLPFISGWIHSLNAAYTRFVLDYTYNMPLAVDVTVKMALPVEALVICLTMLFAWSAKKKTHLKGWVWTSQSSL